MKVNSFWFLFFLVIYFAFLLPMYNFDRIESPRPLDLDFVFLISNSIFWLLIGAIWCREQIEYKTSGYAFLRVLPVKPEDVIASKFILALFSVIVFVVVHYAWFGRIYGGSPCLVLSRAYVVFIGGLSLVLAGLVYLGFFSFGYARFGKVVLIAWIASLAWPVPAKILFFPKMGISTSRLVEKAAGMNVTAVTFFCLFLFFLIMVATMKKGKAGFR